MSIYPYINTFITKEEIEVIYDRLKSYKIDILKTTRYQINHVNIDPVFLDEYLVINAKRQEEYRSINVIVDYFTEYVRVKCKRFDQDLSPYDYWVKYQSSLRTKCKLRYGTVITEGLNTLIYEKTKQVITMRPTIIKAMYKLFSPSNILDPFCGFGSSLLTAMSCNIDFTGVDPNTALRKGHECMINTLKHTSKTKVIYKPFEDITLDQTYDMIFTSPPFYNVEIYSNQDTQSIIRYKTELEWYNNFLLPMLLKAWSLLLSKGTMILYVSNVYDSVHKKMKFSLTEDIIKYITGLPSSIYLGVISFADINKDKHVSRVQPMFIWKKL